MHFILAVALLLLVAPALAAPPGMDQHPGQHFEIRAEDLPLPGEPGDYVSNAPRRIERGDHVPLVPAGFTVTLFAHNLPHPRRIEVLPDGAVLVVQQGTGQLLHLRDPDGDGVAEQGAVFASGFEQPFGIVLTTAGDLLLSDPQAVWTIPLSKGEGPITRATPPGAFGTPSGHITRSIAIGPGGDLFVGVGSVANLAVEDEPKATIQRFAADGTGQLTFARGLRNATGLRIEPHTGDLYAVVMERDAMGDDLVPDFFTRVGEGDDFGWPYQYAGGFAQPGLGDGAMVKRVAATLPDVLFEAHSAPMDLIFVPQSWPEAYRGAAIVALKGSSNRQLPTGYKLVVVPFGADHRPSGGYANFATGFWIAGTDPPEVWGRPAALAFLPDGGLLVADDFGGTLWKIMPPATE
jgi:glucose/arabinose dehydrogenase